MEVGINSNGQVVHVDKGLESQPEVQALSSSLEFEVQQLGGALSALGSRLSPVRMNLPTSDAKSAHTPYRGASPLGASLAKQVEAIREMAASVRGLTEELAV